jgi:hypothetical protein
MATSRNIARFISEVAPPQYISVMRQRASKMLDTINEEERDIASAKDSSSSSSAPTCASSAAAAAETKYFLKEVHRSFSVFDH